MRDRTWGSMKVERRALSKATFSTWVMLVVFLAVMGGLLGGFVGLAAASGGWRSRVILSTVSSHDSKERVRRNLIFAGAGIGAGAGAALALFMAARHGKDDDESDVRRAQRPN